MMVGKGYTVASLNLVQGFSDSNLFLFFKMAI